MLTTIPGLGSIPPQCSLLRLGFVGLGEKTEKAAKKLDHFVLPSELENIFGDKCKALPILLPFDDRELFCSQQWRREAESNGKRFAVCRGNGTGNGIHLVDLGNGNWEWQDYKCTGYDCSYAKDKNKSCKKTADLIFYVVLDGCLSNGVYQITTHNANSMRYINAQVKVFQPQFGRVDMLPLWLNLIPDEGRDGEGKLYKYYSLSLTLRMSENMAIAQRFLAVDASYQGSEPTPEPAPETPPDNPEKKKEDEPGSKKEFPPTPEYILRAHAKLKSLNKTYGTNYLLTVCKKHCPAFGNDISKGLLKADEDVRQKILDEIVSKGREVGAALQAQADLKNKKDKDMPF